MTNASTNSFQEGAQAIKYCLSEVNQQGCRVLLSIPTLAIIICCNLLKVIIMIMMFRTRNSNAKPLVTRGDAIQSFIELPDPTTDDMCLYDKNMIEKGFWERAKLPQEYYPRKRLWFGACSTKRWVITNVMAVATLVVLGAVNFSFPKSISDAWLLGLDTAASEQTVVNIGMTGKGLSGVVSNLLLADLPQALFSLLFLSYNSLFTFMYAADEWHRFAHEKKTLRVSSPIGDQRSTYWLQMPYKAAFPLVAIAFVFHWLISESLYFSRIAIYDLDGKYVPENDISTIGYSFKPLVLVLCLGILVVCGFGIISGFVRFKAGLPLAGGCSAVISAACHGAAQGDCGDDVLRPLKWCVVCGADSLQEAGNKTQHTHWREEFWNSRDLPGHCAFSSAELAMPTPGHFYK
ncbi:uncharacterized protein LY89DRAFT_720111 [Mollisia scopiformis]|uniref:Uncharacterized protein n=1 Tax=Mollisia scopiformis TaxID=149040 RepID=A0A194X361_MOLSC|nr:uncharacterized protein LY89DRAFT_720111 [Mollisia scopiformis]KUJ14616.1 hypothetical protein LY89DRAFT_720111 [Mollisia scopiformis]